MDRKEIHVNDNPSRLDGSLDPSAAGAERSEPVGLSPPVTRVERARDAFRRLQLLATISSLRLSICRTFRHAPGKHRTCARGVGNAVRWRTISEEAAYEVNTQPGKLLFSKQRTKSSTPEPGRRRPSPSRTASASSASVGAGAAPSGRGCPPAVRSPQPSAAHRHARARGGRAAHAAGTRYARAAIDRALPEPPPPSIHCALLTPP